MRALVCLALLSWCVLACAGCPSLDRYYRALDRAEVTLDVPYRDDGHPKHHLDVYLPKDVPAGFSTVVFVHGGYWKAQDRQYLQSVTGLYGNVGTSLAEHGVAAVVTSYRLFPEATLDDMLDDVVASVAWARDHVRERGGDPTSLFLAGHSAGGHLVAQLATHPEELRARGVSPEIIRGVVSLSGIYDIAATVERVSPELRAEVFDPLFGTSPGQQLAASPKGGFGRTMLPTYFIVGELDYKSCLHDHATAQRELAPLIGDRAFFATLEGNEHADMVLEIGGLMDEVTPRMVAFVRRQR